MGDPKEKIKFAVVGCGQIGKRHISLLRAHESADLVALVDSEPDTLRKVAFEGAACFHALDDFLESELAGEIEVVTIATPNGSHAELAMRLLGAKKHVVIEKPMALSKKEAEQIILKSLDVHRHVFIVKQNRYSPPTQWLKKITADNVLGKIYLVEMNCFWNRDERYYTRESWHGSTSLDGGILFTQFSHFIDILYWVFGDIKNIKSVSANYRGLPSVEFEDCGIALFEFINGGMGSVNFSTAIWDKNLESSITVIAEKGSLKIGGQYMNKVEYCHIRDYEMPLLPEAGPNNQYGGYSGSAANHQYIFDNVVNVIRDGYPISANAFEGMKVVEIIERIYESAGRK